VGYGMYIVLDKDDNPHISYLNYSVPAIKYAFRKDGKWKVQQVDRMAGVGYPDRTSLALDDEGRAFIGYYDAGQASLKLAHQEGSAWYTETIDSNGCGYTSSLQIHGDTVWISYADDGSRGIRVARAPLAEFHIAGTAQDPAKPSAPQAAH
jgi:hypothetical protein